MEWTGRSLLLALLVAGLPCGTRPARAEDPPPTAPPPGSDAPPAAPADPRRVRPPTGASPDLRWLLPYGARGQTLPEAERALVAGALAWIASQQRGDGGWDRGADTATDPFRVGLTALSILAFLGAGHSPEGRTPYAETLRRGLDYLHGLQGPDGAVGTLDGNPSAAYGLAFATQALVEAAAVTGDGTRLVIAQKALDALQHARNPYFAWRYGSRPKDNDTSVSGCMWAAIHAAHVANRAAAKVGLAAPFATDPEADDGMAAWMTKMTDPDTGRLGYTQRGTGPARPESGVDAFPAELSESLTAIAVWFRLARAPEPSPPPKPGLDAPSVDPAVEKGLSLISKLAPPDPLAPGAVDYYFWHYASLAMSLAPPKTAAAWNAALDGALRRLARLDDHSHHWETPDAWTERSGFVYATSMATLALEARWRYAASDVPELWTLARTATAAPEARARALGMLTLLRAPKVAELIDAALEAPEGALRLAGAWATERTRSAPAHMRSLKGALSDPDATVAVAAARALATAGKGRETALTSGFTHASPAVRAATLDAAAGIASDPVVAAARAALADADLGVRASATEVLLAAGVEKAELLPVLSAVLASPEDALRRRALGVFTRLGPAAASASASIEALVREGSPSVRIAASAAWIALKGPSAQGLRVLTEALVAEDPLLREEAARHLAAMGPLAASEAVPLATALLTDPDAIVRATAAQALGAFGREGRDARRALETAVLDPVADVAKAAAEALARVRDGLPSDASAAPPADAAALRAALADGVRAGPVRAPVVAAAASTTPWLETLAKDKDAAIRIRALELLGDLVPAAKTPSPVLVGAVSDADAGVRAAALRALGRAKGLDPAVFPLAATAVRDADLRVRSAALALLCAAPVASPESLAASTATLDAARDPAVRGAEGDAARVVEALARWKIPAQDGVWAKVVATAAKARYPAFAVRAIRSLPPGIALGSLLFEDLVAFPVASRAPEVGEAVDAALEAILRKAPDAGPVLVKRWLKALPAKGIDRTKERALLMLCGPAAVPPLLDLVLGTEKRQAEAAANVLSRLPDALIAQMALVCGAAPRMDPLLRYRLVMVGRVGKAPGMVDALLKALRGPTPEIRTGAAMLAKEMATSVEAAQQQALRKTLEQAVSKEKNPAALAAQKSALGSLGGR